MAKNSQSVNVKSLDEAVDAILIGLNQMMETKNENAHLEVNFHFPNTKKKAKIKKGKK